MVLVCIVTTDFALMLVQTRPRPFFAVAACSEIHNISIMHTVCVAPFEHRQQQTASIAAMRVAPSGDQHNNYRVCWETVLIMLDFSLIGRPREIISLADCSYRLGCGWNQIRRASRKGIVWLGMAVGNGVNRTMGLLPEQETGWGCGGGIHLESRAGCARTKTIKQQSYATASSYTHYN